MSTESRRKFSTLHTWPEHLPKSTFDEAVYKTIQYVSEGYSADLSLRKVILEMGLPTTDRVKACVRNDERYKASTGKIFKAKITWQDRQEPSKVGLAKKLNEKIDWEKRAQWVISELNRGVIYSDLKYENKWATITSFRENLSKGSPLLQALEILIPRRRLKPLAGLPVEESLRLIHDLVVVKGFSTSYTRSVIPDVWVTLNLAKGHPLEQEIRAKVAKKTIKDARSSIVSAHIQRL